MLQYTDFAGVIFDVDDTLLDNKPYYPEKRLHERSRRAAIEAVGKRRGIKALQSITHEENHHSFRTAKTHSLEGAIWNLMYSKGIVDTEVIDLEHELVREIATLKNELHEAILRTEGEEVPGASAFVKALAAHGLEGKLAIASAAVRRDIDIFLEMYGLLDVFPPDRIIDKHQVTHMKPHPEVYEEAFLTLGLPAKLKRKVAAFEDDPRGVASAKAVGLYVFAIATVLDKDEWAKQDVQPDIVADSYAEFAKLIGLPGVY